jgi:hypothetical protein
MTARRSRTILRGAAGVGRFVVVCRRFDGREREFQRYASRAEAEGVAARLTAIGCPSRCATDDELALEGTT